MKNSADLGGCFPPRPSASVDNTLLDLQNSSYPTEPHSIIAKYWLAPLHRNNCLTFMVSALTSGLVPWPGILCCVLGPDTVPLSIKLYQWVMVNLMLNITL